VTRRFQFARLRRFLESPWAKYFVVAFGLLIRIIALARIGGRFLYYENTAYDRMAVEFLHNVKFSPYWPPGVPYYLMLAHMVFGEGLLVARASILLIYVAFSFGLYALVRELWSRRAANIAVLTFVLYPSYIRWSFNPSTEYPAAACLVAIVWLTAVTIRKRSAGVAVELGLLLGVLALVRGSSLGLVILVPVFVFYRTRVFTLAVVPLLIAAIPISAWLWKVHDMTGRFVMINESNAENFFQSNNAYTPLYNTCIGGPVPWNVPPQFTALERDIECQQPAQQQQTYRRLAIQHIFSRPDLFLLRSFNRFRAFFCFPIHRGEPLTGRANSSPSHGWLGMAITAFELCFYWPIMILAIIFYFNLANFGFDSKNALLLLGTIFIYAFPCFLTCSQPRYNFPVVPVFAVFACIFLDTLIDKPWRELVVPRQKLAMILTLAFFAYIQIEWMVILVSSGTI
jgi:4-amino-4-deoxy-L-arabinose transferase-like glycosyltransferase